MTGPVCRNWKPRIQQHRRVEFVSNAASVALGADEISVAEHGELSGNGRADAGEALGDLARV